MTLDEEKVLKKLKNKHTKESIILLDYIEKLNKTIEEIETNCKHDLAFERKLKRDNIEPDLFNQGRFSTCEDVLEIIKRSK